MRSLHCERAVSHSFSLRLLNPTEAFVIQKALVLSLIDRIFTINSAEKITKITRVIQVMLPKTWVLITDVTDLKAVVKGWGHQAATDLYKILSAGRRSVL